MKSHVFVLIALALVAGCRREQSVASKSSAAYREAQAKGLPVGGGHDHGAHAVATATNPAVDHAAMGHTVDAHAAHRSGGAAVADHSAHTSGSTAVDHAAMGHGTRSTPVDHAAMGHGTGSTSVDHAAMGHGTTVDHSAHRGASPQTAHAQHETGASPATTGHEGHTAQATLPSHDQHAATAPAPTASLQTAPILAASPLRADAFDAPAAVAVAEAAKAQAAGGHEGHQVRGITPGEDRENPPTPMPATRDRTNTRAPATSPDSAAVVYTCPMHPEVMSDKPGTCPKCGMTLVRKD